MVTIIPELLQQQGFYLDYSSMPTPGHSNLPASRCSGVGEVALTAEDQCKKVRKPYTITKSRENRTDQEHDKFLQALRLFDRDWKNIEAFVGSKTVIQIRSHAQKYFLKVQKTGSSEHVPPPRPKRKAAHPYPQKAPKTAPEINRLPRQSQSSATNTVEPGYAYHPDSSSMLVNRSAVSTPSWLSVSVPAASSSNMRTVIPDFSQVYGFIGSVFDPSADDHMQRLKMMDPVNLETALLLMRNLSENLLSPNLEEHASYCKLYAFCSYEQLS